jgi:hypothetical protein
VLLDELMSRCMNALLPALGAGGLAGLLPWGRNRAFGVEALTWLRP